MKKIIFSFLIVIVVLLGINFVLAKDSPNGQPFDFLWESVNSLVEQVSGQQGQIDEQQEQISNQQTQIDNILERIEELEAKECVPGFTESCDTGLLGVCSVGTRTCSQNQIWGTCIQNIQPSLEVLDDLDNDCNGVVDDIPLYPVLEDDFNSYHDGDLNGQGNWSGNALAKVQGDITYEGAKAVRWVFSNGEDLIIDNIQAPVPNGKQIFYIMTSDITYTYFSFQLRNNGLANIDIRWVGNNFQYEDSVGIYHDIKTNMEANVWYLIEIEWRNSDYKVKYRINNETWTDWVFMRYSGVPDRVRVNPYGVHGPWIGYLDYFATEPI